MNENVLNSESFAILQRIFKYSKKWKNILKKWQKCVFSILKFRNIGILILLGLWIKGFPAMPELLIGVYSL
jgi:hypothetical protein